jgi:hypothetical protein
VKQVYQSVKHKRHQRQRARRARVERKAFAAYQKEKHRSERGLTKHERTDHRIISSHAKRGFLALKAPSRMSVIKYPEETVGFFNKLMIQFERRRKVFVSLKNVSVIDYDAIVVLLSIMVKFKAARIEFNGDLPDDPAAKNLLIRSRFFESLYKEFREKDLYQIGTEKSIYTHATKTVDPIISAKIIEVASQTVWSERRRCQGVQRIFLELMQNTNNHASLEGQGEKHWWLSVSHRKKENKVLFTFVDFGVGIFNSLDNKQPGSKWFAWRTALGAVFALTNNAEILKLILQGHMHKTVTGKYYRGKGLPGIYDVLQRKGISNLFIITNDVYADVSNGVYSVLKNNFGGTLIYWELDKANASTQDQYD